MMRFLVLCLTALTAVGCVNTRGAYSAAESPEEYAFVVAEHYNVLVNEAADLAEQATTPQRVKDALKAADAKAKPLVVSLRGLAENYAAAKTAESKEELQQALNQAVLAVAEFIRVLRSAQTTSSVVMPPSYRDELVFRLARTGGAT